MKMTRRKAAFVAAALLGLALAPAVLANCSVIRADCSASYRAALQSCGNSAACKQRARAQYQRCIGIGGC